jgi:hypothetical protein
MGLVNKALSVYLDWLDDEAKYVLAAGKKMRDDFAAARENAIKCEEELGDLRDNFIIITKKLLADKKVQQDIVRTSMSEEEVHVAELVICLANEEYSEDNNDLKEAGRNLRKPRQKWHPTGMR